MNKQQLANKISSAANIMHSKLAANEYKDNILGFISYKYLRECVGYKVTIKAIESDSAALTNCSQNKHSCLIN